MKIKILFSNTIYEKAKKNFTLIQRTGHNENSMLAIVVTFVKYKQRTNFSLLNFCKKIFQETPTVCPQLNF